MKCGFNRDMLLVGYGIAFCMMMFLFHSTLEYWMYFMASLGVGLITILKSIRYWRTKNACIHGSRKVLE